MKRIFKYLVSHPIISCELLGLSLAANVLALVSPVFVILVLNRYVSYGVDATLITLASGTAVAIIFEYLFRRLRFRSAARIGHPGFEALDNQIFQKTSQAKIGYLNRIPKNILRGVFNSNDEIKSIYSPTNLCVFLDAPFAILFLFALYLICPPILYLVVVVISILAAIVLVQLGGLRVLGRSLNKENSSKSRLINEVIALPETLRLFDNSERLATQWSSVSETFDKSQNKMSDRKDRSQTIIRSFSSILTVLVISLGAVLVVDGQLDVGAMIGANILATRAMGPVISLCQQAEGWGRAEQAFQTIADFDRLPIAKSDGTAINNYAGNIQFRDVSFSYTTSESPLIERLNFSLEPGEVLCISGSNSSGKTTIANLISGLLEPNQGFVTVDGINLQQISQNWWRQQIIYLPQEPDFFAGTIRDNFLAFNPEITAGEIRTLMIRVGLGEFVDKTVGGLDQIISGPERKISLGIRRRIALARALTHDGNLVLLDEPTEGIDGEGAASVYSVMNELSRQGKTLIICSHDTTILKGAHHVLDLDDGREANMHSVQN